MHPENYIKFNTTLQSQKMKKIFTLFAAAVVSVMCMTLSAEVVTTEMAKQTADNFLALDNEWHGATDAQVRL